VLRLCAKRKGVWFDEDQFDLVRRRMIHNVKQSDKLKSAKMFARRFYNYFLVNTVGPYNPRGVLEVEARAA
jgi:hypothetical protein